MSGANAIASAAGAGDLIAGATPYGWAKLGAGVLSGVAGASKPGGPSEANSNPFFGPMVSPFDSSGWTVNFGDGANQTAKAGDRAGPNVTPTNSVAQPGGYAASAGPGGSASGGLNINPIYLVGGALLLVLLWRRR